MSAAVQAVIAQAGAQAVPQSVRSRDLRDCLANLPDPHDYVYCMTPEMVALLMQAYRKHSILLMPLDLAPALRPFGLVDYTSCALTAFGHDVWRVLAEESH